MRLRTGMGLVLLAAGACAHLPGQVKIETEEGSIEIKKKASAEAERGDDERR